MGWNYLSIPKLQWCSRWSLGMDKLFHPTHYWACNYLSMLGLNLIHVSKRSYSSYDDLVPWCLYEYSGLSELNLFGTERIHPLRPGALFSMKTVVPGTGSPYFYHIHSHIFSSYFLDWKGNNWEVKSWQATIKIYDEIYDKNQGCVTISISLSGLNMHYMSIMANVHVSEWLGFDRYLWYNTCGVQSQLEVWNLLYKCIVNNKLISQIPQGTCPTMYHLEQKCAHFF